MDKLTVAEAAARLGVSQDAVRKRIHRNTISWDKDDEGRVYVYLDPAETVSNTVQDTVKDAYINSLKSQIDLLQDQVDTLKIELDDRKEEARRKDHLLAAALERIPAIEPPAEEQPDAPESPVTASEEEAKSETPREPEREPEKAELRPWWRRLFSG